MNKNGFTLIELLAVIVILAIIAGITFPIIQDSINKSKDKTYNEQIRTIQNAAERWVNEHIDTFKGTSCKCKPVSELISEGYIVGNSNNGTALKNPIDSSKNMNGAVKIKKDADYNQYTYNYTDSCSC